MFGFGQNKKLLAEIASLKEQVNSIQNESVDSSEILKGSRLWEAFTGGAVGASGVSVTERTAMGVAAVYACVGLIAGAIAGLPLPIYQRTKDGRERVDHDLWWLLNEQPIDGYSAPVFWEFLVQSLLLRGDCFAEIKRCKGGRDIGSIIGFNPLSPGSVTPIKNGNRLLYIIEPDEGEKYIVDQDDMLHVPGIGFNGLNGMSQIRGVLANTAGTSIAADNHAGSFFKNGARPDYVLETDSKLTAEQITALRDQLTEIHGGAGKNSLPGVFANGLKAKPLTISPEDAQLLQTRGFQVVQTCMAFRVPPHMIGYNEKTTSWGTGVEQLSLGFSKYTLKPHLIKFEKEINRKCFRTSRHFCEFNLSGLERGDYKSRNEGYRIALGRAGEPAWMTINEVRKLENLKPIEGGDDINKGTQNESTQETV